MKKQKTTPNNKPPRTGGIEVDMYLFIYFIMLLLGKKP